MGKIDFGHNYMAIPVEKELPPLAMIVVVLLDGRLPMMAQTRPCNEGVEWWSLGMSKAHNIESNKKCVTHWLKPVLNSVVFTKDQLEEFQTQLQK